MKAETVEVHGLVGGVGSRGQGGICLFRGVGVSSSICSMGGRSELTATE